MRWELGRRSQNIEDRRGMPGGMGGVARGGGIGGLGLIALLLLSWAFGIDPTLLLQDLSQGSSTSVPDQRAPSRARAPQSDERTAFVSAVLGDTEDTWHALFEQMGRTYREPTLVLFSGAVQSACGFAEAAVGPFYCPGDQKVYLDLSFFDELHDRFGAPGDFAQAYVIAHEVGHHVQNLLGIADQVQGARQRADERGGNALSVMMELQADCFAGVWGYHAGKSRHLLETGDIEEGLNAAAAIGDDRLQRQAQGYVVPESFTHGSSAQRVRWFQQGLNSGDPGRCDTFAGAGR
jgi:predicted metalloprotease